MRGKFELILERRINWVLLFFFLMFGALIGRLFMMQIVSHQEYVDLAERQHRSIAEIYSERGPIFMQDKKGALIPLALNYTKKTVAASPKMIQSPGTVAALLSREFKMDKQEIEEKLSKKDDPYEILIKSLDANETKRVEEFKISGLFFEEEKRRVYPQGNLAAHAIGFVSKEDIEEKGRYGLERMFERELSGKRGAWEDIRDAAGFLVALGRRIINPPENGSRLVLTLDYNIQKKAEEILKSVKDKWDAESGAILVIDPKTGRILALGANPSFDPNQYSKEKNFSVFLNPLVESMFELGSVLKPITMAGGLEERVVGPQTTYEDPGEIKIGGYTVRNFDGKAYKTQTMTQVLEKSLNTGAVYVARTLGQERQSSYLKKFGFGEETGIDFPGEVAGNISNLKAGRDIDFATASFGQGIAVTPIQLAMAIGAIANQGKLMKPYVVEKIIDDSGNEIKKDPQVERQVVSKETAETLTKMLVSAVRNGFENRAGVKGYFVAGKTGTAQIPRRDGPGYSDEVIHTFVGYAPAFDPKFLVLIQLNKPKGNRFAANTLTPAFHDLAEYILNYYEIPPDESQ